MASLQKEPLEVSLVRAFGEGGPLEDAYIGQVKFSKLMLGICGKLERLQAHHADEIAALKAGFEQEKKDLLALVKEQPTRTRQVESSTADQQKDALDLKADFTAANGRETTSFKASDCADLESLRRSQEQLAQLKAELEQRTSAQEEHVNSIHLVAAQGARMGCHYCQAVKDTVNAWRSANGLTCSSESVASKYAKMDLRDRDALFAMLDLWRGFEEEAWRKPSPGRDFSAEGELTAEGLLARMTDARSDGVKLGVRRVPTFGDDLDKQLDELDTFCLSSASEDEEETAAIPLTPVLTEAQQAMSQLSQQLDAEAEALNLALKPETVRKEEKSDWEEEARDAKRRRVEAEMRVRSKQAKAASDSGPNRGAKVLVSKPSNEGPRPPSRLGRLPVKASRFSDEEYDRPKMTKKRSRQDLTLPEDPPTDARLKIKVYPPLTPSPTWHANSKPEWPGKSFLGAVSPQGVPLPSPRVTKSPTGADYVREVDAFCKPKHGKEDGQRFEGKLRIWKTGEVMIFCRCPSCVQKNGPDGLGMSPVEFEVHAGRGATKKWRHSIWVALPQPDGQGPPEQSTIEKCDKLNNGKHFTPVGMTSPHAASLRAVPPTPKTPTNKHPDQLVQCKSCGKWRRFRRVLPSDFARAQQVLADPDWKCADHPDPSVASCHIPEERSSRNRKPGCEACYFSELGCVKCRECTGCKYCRPETGSEVVLE